MPAQYTPLSITRRSLISPRPAGPSLPGSTSSSQPPFGSPTNTSPCGLIANTWTPLVSWVATILTIRKSTSKADQVGPDRSHFIHSVEVDPASSISSISAVTLTITLSYTQP